jgi:hypothetical protein
MIANRFTRVIAEHQAEIDKRNAELEDLERIEAERAMHKVIIVMFDDLYSQEALTIEVSGREGVVTDNEGFKVRLYVNKTAGSYVYKPYLRKVCQKCGEDGLIEVFDKVDLAVKVMSWEPHEIVCPKDAEREEAQYAPEIQEQVGGGLTEELIALIREVVQEELVNRLNVGAQRG